MKYFSLLFVCFVLLGCASSNPTLGIAMFGQIDKNTYQTFEGTLTTETFVLFPLGSSLNDFDDMGLKIGRITLNGNVIKYRFQAEVHTGNWIFADTIRIKIDDKIYRLTDNSPIRQIHSDGYVLEVLTIDISPEILEEIKTSNAFSAELYKRVVNLNEKQLEELKQFML